MHHYNLFNSKRHYHFILAKTDDPCTTGIIYTNKTIMFKAGESIIQFVVVAKDKGNPPQSSMVAVHIQITDVNKYPPTFVASVNYM